MKRLFRKLLRCIPAGIVCLVIIFLLFGYLASKMGTANMLNTIMNTSHDLLLNTVFYLMAICVITGAIGKIFVEFGVVKLLEKLLRPLMKPLFNLPGVASLGAVMTFLSDNPAIISLAQDKRFATYFKKYQFISLTNFGTAFGMGLLVIVFMVGQGYFVEPFVGLFGAVVGCIISTRLMQRFVIKAYPSFKTEDAMELQDTAANVNSDYRKPLFQRILDSLLDGGRSGVEVGLAIIPGVLIISTLVMLFTFGPNAEGEFTGAAYQGVELLPWIGEKFNVVFNWLFGFTDSHLIAFPITALGAVGAALGLVPNFSAEGWIDGNAIAVFTAIGMCWSGYLSTHTAMLDTIGYRRLTSKAILAHTVGGFVAGIVAHWVYVLISLLFFSPVPVEQITKLNEGNVVEMVWTNDDCCWSDADGDGIAMQEFKISVPREGCITVVLCNDSLESSLNTYGVVLVDTAGNTIVSDYHIGRTNDGTGVTYVLENVPKGIYPLRGYVQAVADVNAVKGKTKLCFDSDRQAECNRLKELMVVVKYYIDKKDSEGLTEYALLCHQYTRCEALVRNEDVTEAQLMAGYEELDDALGLYTKAKQQRASEAEQTLQIVVE